MPFEPPRWYARDLPPAASPEIDAALLYAGTPPATFPFTESPPAGEPGQDDGVVEQPQGFWTEEQAGSEFYSRYEVTVRRTIRTGLYGMPRAEGKGGRTDVVRTHAPTATFVVA